MKEENGEFDSIADLESGWKEQLNLAEEEIDDLKRRAEALTKDLIETHKQIEEMNDEYVRLATKHEQMKADYERTRTDLLDLRGRLQRLEQRR